LLETARKDQESGKQYVSEDTLNQAEQFSTKLSQGMGKLGNFESVFQKETREKNESIAVLSTYVRDTWEGLRRRIKRENLPSEVFAYYKLPKSGNSPELITDGQWLETASMLVAGETDAIAAGYQPMTNPSIVEVKEKLDVAISESGDVSEADKNLDEAQEAVSDLMPGAKKLIDRILAELNFNLYDKDDASRRRIMRNYGVRFDFYKNEHPEEESDTSLN
jgi:hypothetical protein